MPGVPRWLGMRGKFKKGGIVMARKDISAIVRGAGMAADIWMKLDKAVKDRGGGDEDIHRLATEEGERLISEIADLVVRSGRMKDVFSVTVNYNQTVEDMVKAGEYDWKNQDINSRNFPIIRRGTSEFEIHLVHFGKTMSSEDVLRELDKMGLRSAEFPELLRLGATHPDLQRQFLIVALGSVFRGPYGYRYVPVLWTSSGRRELDLGWFRSAWGGGYRFAAVRK